MKTKLIGLVFCIFLAILLGTDLPRIFEGVGVSILDILAVVAPYLLYKKDTRFRYPVLGPVNYSPGIGKLLDEGMTQGRIDDIDAYVDEFMDYPDSQEEAWNI